jgi:hypothetical protein
MSNKTEGVYLGRKRCGGSCRTSSQTRVMAIYCVSTVPVTVDTQATNHMS